MRGNCWTEIVLLQRIGYTGEASLTFRRQREGPWSGVRAGRQRVDARRHRRKRAKLLGTSCAWPAIRIVIERLPMDKDGRSRAVFDQRGACTIEGTGRADHEGCERAVLWRRTGATPVRAVVVLGNGGMVHRWPRCGCLTRRFARCSEVISRALAAGWRVKGRGVDRARHLVDSGSGTKQRLATSSIVSVVPDVTVSPQLTNRAGSCV